MSHRWMFDVLTDLETYARRNGLPQFAQRLSEAAGQAAREARKVLPAAGLLQGPPAHPWGAHMGVGGRRCAPGS